jgi:imidazolonepropionase-like amidohydrolase
MTMLDLVCSLTVCALAQGNAPANAPPALLIKAKTIVVAPDVRLTDGHILLRGGRVAAVGADVPATLAADVARVDLGDATVVPGLVLPHAYLAAAEDLAETADAYTPELRAVEAYDPFGEKAERMLAGGVTTVAVAPRSANTFAGLGGAVKTGPAGGAVLREQCFLKVALVPESLDQQRFPTSRMGALDLVRTAFTGANSGLAAPTASRQPLRDVLAGAFPLAVHARTHDEITCALDLFDPAREGVLAGTQARLILIGANAAARSLERIARLQAGVWIEPLRPGLEAEALELPGLLAGRGIRLGFAADSPAQLRLSVALAVRHGLDRSAALAALTQIPAAMLGVDDRVGTLLQGKDADLAVFTGDPIDLGSRVLAVCVGGRPVVANAPFPGRQ